MTTEELLKAINKTEPKIVSDERLDELLEDASREAEKRGEPDETEPREVKNEKPKKF